TASSDGVLLLWDLTGTAAPRALAGHTESIVGVTIAPDGRTAVSCSSDGTARVWDLETGMAVRLLNIRDLEPTSVAMSPDGATIAWGSEGCAGRLWALATGVVRQTLWGHRGGVACVASARSGARLVRGSRDGRILVGDPQQDEPLRIVAGRR